MSSTPAQRVAFVHEVADAVHRVAGDYGLPPSPTDVFVAGHAALSSGWGQSALALQAHNLWGIKMCTPKAPSTTCTSTAWPGPFVVMNTKEYDAGDVVRPEFNTHWRKYDSVDQAVGNYFHIISTAPRYKASYALLKAGDPDYMAQLGRDGWYTHSPAAVKAEWLSGVRYASKVLGVPVPEGADDSSNWLLAAGVVAAYWFMTRRTA